MSVLRIFSEKELKNKRSLCLKSDIIHVWIINRDFFKEYENAGFANYLESTLTFEELEKSKKFRKEDDRFRSSISRGLIRFLGALYSNTDERQLDIKASPTGKPYFAGKGEDIKFNISHSGKYIALAFAKGKDLGIDVERRNPDIDTEGVSSFFAEEERECIKACGDFRMFYDIWTCKEAFLKLTGEGLLRSLDSFTIRGEKVIINGMIQEGFQIKKIYADDNYSAAIAFRQSINR